MDLDSVAEELYGSSLDEFVSTRNEREKQAKADGDRELAAAIHRLAKPSATAWLANQLVRRHRDDVEPLLELGAGLRAAMASLSGPELRTLGQQQHRLIAALVAKAGALAVEDGRRVSTDTARALEQTLHAALADESTAQSLLQGRLTEALLDSGFTPDPGSVQPARAARPTKASPAHATGKSARPSKSAGPSKSTDEGAAREAARRLAAMRAEREQAQAALDAALAARDQAVAAADDAEKELDDTVARIARLREELDRATSDKSRLDHDHHRLRTDAAKAERAVTSATNRLEAASESD